MTKLKIKCVLMNAGNVACIIAGFGFNRPGIQNIVLFFNWFLMFILVCGYFADSEKFISVFKKNQNKDFSPAFKSYINVAISGLYIYFGAWFTGLCWLIILCFIQAIRVEALKKK